MQHEAVRRGHQLSEVLRGVLAVVAAHGQVKHSSCIAPIQVRLLGSERVESELVLPATSPRRAPFHDLPRALPIRNSLVAGARRWNGYSSSSTARNALLRARLIACRDVDATRRGEAVFALDVEDLPADIGRCVLRLFGDSDHEVSKSRTRANSHTLLCTIATRRLRPPYVVSG